LKVEHIQPDRTRNAKKKRKEKKRRNENKTLLKGNRSFDDRFVCFVLNSFVTDSVVNEKTHTHAQIETSY